MFKLTVPIRQLDVEFGRGNIDRLSWLVELAEQVGGDLHFLSSKGWRQIQVEEVEAV